MEKKKNNTRCLKVIDSRAPWFESVIIEHDLDALIRETLGKEEPKLDKPPAEVVPLPKKNTKK